MDSTSPPSVGTWCQTIMHEHVNILENELNLGINNIDPELLNRSLLTVGEIAQVSFFIDFYDK